MCINITLYQLYHYRTKNLVIDSINISYRCIIHGWMKAHVHGDIAFSYTTK